VADPVLVLEHVGPAREIDFQGFPERSDVLGVHPLQPVLGAPDVGVRWQPDHRAPASGDVELLGPQVPLPEPVVRTFGRQRQPLSIPFDLVVGAHPGGDVLPQQRHATGNRQHLHLKDPCVRASADLDIGEGSRLGVSKHVLDRLGQLRACNGWHDLDRASDRLLPRASEHPFERVVPDGDLAFSVEDRHSMLEEVEDLVTMVVLFETAHIIGVDAVEKEQRRRGHRQDSPHPLVDQCDQAGRDTRPDEIPGAASERQLGPRPVHRTSRRERHHDRDEPALDHGIAEDGRGDETSLPGPHAGDGGRDGRQRLIGLPGDRGGQNGDGGIDESVSARIGAFRNEKARGQGPGGSDQRRDVRTEHQQRADGHDEGRRHDRPILRRGRLHPEE
jgi:hypothetical protein